MENLENCNFLLQNSSLHFLQLFDSIMIIINIYTNTSEDCATFSLESFSGFSLQLECNLNPEIMAYRGFPCLVPYVFPTLFQAIGPYLTLHHLTLFPLGLKHTKFFPVLRTSFLLFPLLLSCLLLQLHLDSWGLKYIICSTAQHTFTSGGRGKTES